MNRLFPLLLLLVVPALPASAASTTGAVRPADPQRVVDAFADLCLRAPHAWGAVRSWIANGGGRPEGLLPTADAPADARFTINLRGTPVQVEMSRGTCTLTAAPVDAAATLARLDTLGAGLYAAMKRYTPVPGAAPTDGEVLREVGYTFDPSFGGTRIAAVTSGVPDAPRLVLSTRHESVETGEAKADDFPPSEDISGRRQHPPRYPGAALRKCAGGTTMMLVTVDARGEVVDVVVERSAGRRDLDAAAVEAARKWRYNPGILGGALVGGDIRVPINFTANCGRG